MSVATSPRTGMSRAEAFEWVSASRSDGWTYRQIAAELCCSPAYVRELLNDPTGEKGRERKRRTLMQPCADCGAQTWGVRCESCAVVRSKAARYWTVDVLLDAAREWRRRFGDWPTVNEWMHAQTLEGYRFPNFAAAYHRGCGLPWSSWSGFLIAAGASPDAVSVGKRRQNRTRT